MVKRVCCYEFIFLCYLLFLAAVVYSKDHGNPANDLVDIINKNRTDQKLPHLNNSPGLGCMALQYIELCSQNCSRNNTTPNCKPPEDDFIEIFAPNCGVELPTFDTITGQIIRCQSKYLEPPQAFSHILIDKKTLSLVTNKSHTEVGVGLLHVHKGPVFWCILFSNGQTNSTFVLENQGKGIKQKKGCFSGSNFSCNSGQKNTPMSMFFNFMTYFMFYYVLQHL